MATRPTNPSMESAPAALPSVVRHFGRLQLLQLLGKSERTMAWRVEDPRNGDQLMLVLPRLQPANPKALDFWQQTAQRAARLSHPRLAEVVEMGVQDGWPFVTHRLSEAATLADRLPQAGMPGAEAAALAIACLQGLAFAHEAGISHDDLQPFLLLVDDHGAVRVAGLAVAAEIVTAGGSRRSAGAIDPAALRARREAAESDVLACGILLHALLVGHAAMATTDLLQLASQLPPEGREPLRLPWTTAHPVGEALRAIADRSTDRQPLRRYRNARTLLKALEGWLQSESEEGGGPVAVLMDRLRTSGALPSSPGAAARAARLAMMERERIDELADVVLEDLALSFEMLRLVNTAQVRSSLAGAGPVLAVRRSIALLGLSGVRRAALALRAWPGPLDSDGAKALQSLVKRCRHAARTAVALRPAGYDAEVVFLIALLQNLSRLMLHYHFADEARQVLRLQQPLKSAGPDGADEPGLTESAACHAVIGVDLEALGAAVARQWGLVDDVVRMVRRHSTATPVRAFDDDADVLRAVASCANEAVDAQDLPAAARAAALRRVVQRYGRLLQIGLPDLLAALQAAPQPMPRPVAPDSAAAATSTDPDDPMNTIDRAAAAASKAAATRAAA